jgi:hypothetical protein
MVKKSRPDHDAFGQRKFANTPNGAAENGVSRVLRNGIVQLLQLQLEGQPHGNVFPAVPSAFARHR